MQRSDLDAVERIGAAVHPGYPEDAVVVDERLHLYSAGCRVLAIGSDIHGYAVSHPWRFASPPGLNTLLQHLPERPDSFYLHDIALMPHLRGAGHGRSILRMLADQAQVEELDILSLIAVGGSLPFWQKHGFQRAEDTPPSLQSYGAAAILMWR